MQTGNIPIAVAWRPICTRMAPILEKRGWSSSVSGPAKQCAQEAKSAVPKVFDVTAKTSNSVAMKAHAVRLLFAGKDELRSAAIRSLTDDIAAVMGELRL